MKEYKDRRAGGRRTAPIVAGVVVIAIVVVALYYYARTPTSNTVYCGILQYAVFPALSIVGSQTITLTHTLTTIISYTTTTSPGGPIGQTYSNSSTTSNTSGYSAGIETICRYISSPSSTYGTSSTSTTA